MLALLLLGRQFPQKQRPLHLDTRLLYRLRSGQRPATFGIDKSSGFKVGTVSTMSYDPEQSQNVVAALRSSEIPPFRKFESTHFQRRHHGAEKPSKIVPGSSPELLQPGDTLYSRINKGFLREAAGEFEFIKRRANGVISHLTVAARQPQSRSNDNRAGLNTTVNNAKASITGNIS